MNEERVSLNIWWCDRINVSRMWICFRLCICIRVMIACYNTRILTQIVEGDISSPKEPGGGTDDDDDDYKCRRHKYECSANTHSFTYFPLFTGVNAFMHASYIFHSQVCTHFFAVHICSKGNNFMHTLVFLCLFPLWTRVVNYNCGSSNTSVSISHSSRHTPKRYIIMRIAITMSRHYALHSRDAIREGTIPYSK